LRKVLDWLIPKRVKDIQKFLGLANYYWKFIKDFTMIARPLHNMVQKKPEVRIGRKIEKGI